MRTVVLFEGGIIAEGAVAAGEPGVGGLHCKLVVLVRSAAFDAVCDAVKLGGLRFE